MNLRESLRAAVGSLLCVLIASADGSAQSVPGNFREVQVAATAFSLGDPIPSWVDPVAVPQAGKAQPIVFRLVDSQWLVGSTPVVHVHRAIMVNDAASLTSAGQLPIQFVPEYQRLQLHAIHILRGEESLDRTESSTIRFLQRETGLERGVYSGVVTVSILVNDLRVGDTIELSYSLHGQNPVFGGKFADAAAWDQPYPTVLRRVILNYSTARGISWRLVGDDQSRPLIPRESTHEGMRKLIFEEQSIPGIVAEPLTPLDHVAYRWLQFSEFSGWEDVVGWARGLFQADGVLDDDLREIVGKLRARTTNEERVVGALEFVQSEIRYFSVSLGESSHRPTQPNVVLKRRYGDCKDKSFLLLTLLRELGIQSNPVLVKFGRRKGLDQLLPSPQLFDHVIVQANVDDNVFYLDPTRLGQHGRLSRMGQAHEGAQVLVVAPEGRQFSTISGTNVLDLVRNERFETAALPQLGADGQLQTRQVWNGLAAETIRVMHEHFPHEQVVKSIGDAMEVRYPGSKLVGEPEIQDDRVNNVLSITARYNVPKLAAEKDGNWFVRFNASNLKGALVIPPSSVRTAPLGLPGFPFEAKYTFEVTFPDEVSVVADPRAETVEDKYFIYTVTAAFRGNVSKTTIDLKTLAGHVEVQDLQKYAEDLRAADNITKGVVLVPKQQIKSVGAAESDKKSLAQTLHDRLQEAIDQRTKVIESGKLAGNDLAAAYCDRGSDYVFLGKADQGFRDVNEAIKLAPNSGNMLSCRGELYFDVGEFEKSIADYSKAITLGATRPSTFRLRGVSNFYAGRLEEATDDLSRASAAADKESRVYIDLWLTWAHQRLGKPIPEAVAKRAAAEPRGDWPRPALAMLTGDLTPQEMLQLLDGKTGDDRQMALAEAYFYLGQHYLALEDNARAREFFEKTLQLEVFIYTEHLAAGFELQRLKGAAEAHTK